MEKTLNKGRKCADIYVMFFMNILRQQVYVFDVLSKFFKIPQLLVISETKSKTKFRIFRICLHFRDKKTEKHELFY